MPTVNYHTLNGQVSATTAGYLTVLMPDALGSVVRTQNDGGGGRTLRYAGYGSTLYDSGSWDKPRNAFVGRAGYRSTQMKHAEEYVRARHYTSTGGRWTTVDPLWPRERAYGYVNGNPTAWTDPSGMKCKICPCSSDPCAYAWIHEPKRSDQADLYKYSAGFVICCCGTAVVCLNNAVLADCRPGVVDCERAHEAYHRGLDKKKCEGVPFAPDVPPAPNEECGAYTTEINCLLEHQSRVCKGDKSCVNDYEEAIKDACEQAKLVPCAGYNLPPLCKSRRYI